MARDVIDELLESRDDHLIDTATVPEDDDPMVSPDGYAELSPGFAEEEMIDALVSPSADDADLAIPPREALDVEEYQRPLSRAEAAALEETPLLDLDRGQGLRYVDDPLQEAWMQDASRRKARAMEAILEDQMYGEDESGFSLTRKLRSGARAIGRGARRAARGASSAARKVASTARGFVPGRDRQKAALLKATAAKLTRGRINFLRAADLKRGLRRPPAAYAQAGKAFARQKLAAAGLPTTTAGDGIYGSSFVGSWYNPFSWFQTRTRYVLQNAAGEMLEMTPTEFEAYRGAQAAQQPGDPAVDPSMVDPSADPSMMDPSMADPYGGYPPGGDEMPYDESMMGDDGQAWDFVVGDDFVGELAAEILGEAPDRLAVLKAILVAVKKGRATKGDARSGVTIARAIPHEKAAAFLQAKLSELRDGAPTVEGAGAAAVRGDSLGALAAEILGADDPAARKAKMAKVMSAAFAAVRDGRATKGDARAAQALARKLGDGNLAKYFLAREPEPDLKPGPPSVPGLAEASMMGMDPFLYKLNPAYWIKSGREKRLVDAEKKANQQAEDTRERLEKQRKELTTGRKAFQAAAAAKAVEKESQDVEAELKDIEASVASGMRGEGDGEVSDDQKAMAARRAEQRAGARELRRKAARCRAVARAARREVESTGAISGPTKQALEACIKEHGEVMEGASQFEAIMVGERAAVSMRGAPLGKKRWVAMAALAATDPSKLQQWQRKNKVKLSATEQAHLKSLAMLTRQAMAKQGVVKGDDLVGLSWKDPLKVAAVAALPAAALAYGAYRGAKYVGQKAGIISKGATPQQARQARINQLRARRLAAMKKLAAAQQRSDASQAEMLAAQEAADAEAAAQDADAAATEDQYAAEDAAALPGMTDYQDGDGDLMGASAFVGDFVGEVDDPKAKKIILAAQKDDATGRKIRAGAKVYAAARKGDPKARVAVKKIAIKARGGDKQAARDLNAVKAGRTAVLARGKAKRKIAKKATAEARARKIRSLENRAGDALARASRRHQLKVASRLERRAAAGDKKAKAKVAAIAKRAAAGDKKAAGAVAAMQLSRRVRARAASPREQRSLKQAARVYRAANRGNKKAIRQVRLIEAAAKAGQPNAKRAAERLKTAALVERAVASGKVTVPPKKASPGAAKAAERKRYDLLVGRVTSGVASKEEALAAAKIGKKMGLKEEAAALAMQARSLRPAAQPIKDAAAVAAAAQAGNKDAQKLVSNVLERAGSGDPEAINSAGKLAAVRAVDAVDRGMPMPAEVAEATGIVERAHAGDPEARRIVQRAAEAAKGGDARGVEAAVALTAASAIIAATASRPGARREWAEKAAEARGTRVTPGGEAEQAELAEIRGKVGRGEATEAEGRRGRELALALGKPKVAAEISALMPPPEEGPSPMSSLPDSPLPPIVSWRDMLRESVRAILFATPNPTGNYLEGVSSRGATPMLAPTASEARAAPGRALRKRT